MTLILISAQEELAQTYRNGRFLNPFQNAQPQQYEKPKVYVVRSQEAPHIGDGNFQYSVETSDGLQAQKVGYLQKPAGSQVHEGSYTTFDEAGKVVAVNFVADHHGFRASGDGLPTPPPVPIEHLQARDNILKQQEQIREQHLANFRAAHAKTHQRQY